MKGVKKILIADSNYLVREGFKAVIKGLRGFEVAAESENGNDLFEKMLEKSPDILVINYACAEYGLELISKVSKYCPHVKILAITDLQTPKTIALAIKNGVLSHLLKDCAKDEIIEALRATAEGEKFYCGKVLEQALNQTQPSNENEAVSCDGIRISGREVEIIRLVADGFTNKQIAEKLFLSAHTIMTHRKNIMNKLGVNNTAGLVLFAIKNGIISPNKFLFSTN
jgi:DNA-binding NarL/FixJ family response regulator